jgi:hypothetical protein
METYNNNNNNNLNIEPSSITEIQQILTTTNEFELLPTTTASLDFNENENVTKLIENDYNDDNNNYNVTENIIYPSTSVMITEKPTVTTTIIKTSNSTNDIFKYIKGSVYENIQNLWRSKFFEKTITITKLPHTSTTRIPTTATTTPIPTTTKITTTITNINNTTTFPTTTNHNLRNFSSAFALTFNLMKSNQIKNQASNFKGINRFPQAFQNNILNDNSTNANLNLSSYRQHNFHFNNFDGQHVLPTSCNCSRTINSSFFDEYTNVWKLSFFVLAFVIGFVSLFLLLSLVFKVLM